MLLEASGTRERRAGGQREAWEVHLAVGREDATRPVYTAPLPHSLMQTGHRLQVYIFSACVLYTRC